MNAATRQMIKQAIDARRRQLLAGTEDDDARRVELPVPGTRIVYKDGTLRQRTYVQHGTVTAYARPWNCRCRECTDASSRARRARPRRALSPSEGKAS